MICYPSLEDATPLIVAGPPRSGTRFVTNVLNSVPWVTIQGEIPTPIMSSVIHLLDQADNVFTKNGKAAWQKNWQATKRDLMFALSGNLTKGSRIQSEEVCLYYGYKTPNHEHYFDIYNKFFHPIRPKYICCVRSFTEHFLSVKARWPQRSIMSVSKRYVKSLQQIRHMKNQRPNDVCIFILDRYIDMGMGHLLNNVFYPLGLDDVGQALDKAGQGPVNTSDQLGVQRQREVTKWQSLFLRAYSRPEREFQRISSEFG